MVFVDVFERGQKVNISARQDANDVAARPNREMPHAERLHRFFGKGDRLVWADGMRHGRHVFANLGDRLCHEIAP
jgi:hypothetical protein